MIAEPYICIKGQDAGTIEWFETHKYNAPWEGTLGPCWMRYANFEREKLKELGANEGISVDAWRGQYVIGLERYISGQAYQKGDAVRYSLRSSELIDYDKYYFDCESNRLLKRAEFLKAVCEKEGVEWLPKEPKQKCLGCHPTGLSDWHLQHCPEYFKNKESREEQQPPEGKCTRCGVTYNLITEHECDPDDEDEDDFEIANQYFDALIRKTVCDELKKAKRPDSDEREFRKELLEYLISRNFGLDRPASRKRLEEMKERFLR